ncbi:peptidase M1 [Tissierella sp. P1]|uniref:M1 family metallopeptidase n=1 Tax=Tissierella sp. P1 TaxID=1280483 RepID=UPI000BA11FA7|nr:M1 family metallopeptidase [Tissierella sp. P1]OZV13789.1 peptidase M1 [Tissierella sp. P1]
MNKKRFLSIALILVILLSSFQLGFAVDLGNLTQYEMNIILNTEDHIVEGEQKVIFTNNYNTDLNSLVFHLYPNSYESYETLPAIGGMYLMEGEEMPKLTEEQKGNIKIKQVYINDKETKYTDENQILKINMEEPLKKGDKVEVKIGFTVKIPEGHHRLHHLEGVYSLTNWYPILSVYNDKDKKWDENPFHTIGESNYSDISNYDVELTVPKRMVAAPTGTIIEEKENGENKTIVIRAEKVRDFVVFMSDKYKVETKEVDGIKVSNYHILEEGKKDSKTADILLDEVVKTVRFMNKTIGKYPYDELRIAETYLGGGAMEYPQAIQMGRYWDMEDINIEESASFLIEAAVHETIHQWWYVAVGNNEFEEPFLDESLTVFTTAYYFEKEYGKNHQNGIDSAIRNSIYPSTLLPLNSNVDQFKDWGDYGEAIYRRGPAFFESLKQKVGEEKFIKILRTYYERNEFKNATIEGLLNIIEEVAGKDIKISMESAVTQPNYYPEDIELTQEERDVYYLNQEKRYLKESEKRNGLIIGSIALRALEGEDVIIVKPEYLSEEDLTKFEQFTQMLIKDGTGRFDLQMKVKEEKDITETDKKGNLILIGYPNKHSVIKEMSSELPIKLDGETIDIEGISIKNENITGTFIAENPNNREKLVQVIFLYENTAVEKNNINNGIEVREGYIIYDISIYKYNPMYSHDKQFIIDTKDIEIQGKYKSSK